MFGPLPIKAVLSIARWDFHTDIEENSNLFKQDAVEACKYLPVFRMSLGLSSTAYSRHCDYREDREKAPLNSKYLRTYSASYSLVPES
jgi:hypothetical protein